MFVFTKENAYGVVRTFVPYFYAWLIGLAPWVQEMMTDIGVSQEGFIVICGTVVYQLIRAVAEKVPWVGSFLIYNKKPDYGLS